MVWSTVEHVKNKVRLRPKIWNKFSAEKPANVKEKEWYITREDEIIIGRNEDKIKTFLG